MKKKYFLMCALAGFMFASCSESLPDGGDDGGGGNTGGDAWVSLNIQTAGTTKALHDPDQENGTAEETKVDKIMAIFFDDHLTVANSNNPNLVSVVSWDTGDAEIGDPGQPVGKPTKAFKVDKTSKAFLIVLNSICSF